MYGDNTPAWRLFQSYFPDLYQVLSDNNIQYKTYSVSSLNTSAQIDIILSDIDILSIRCTLQKVTCTYPPFESGHFLPVDDVRLTNVIRERIAELKPGVTRGEVHNHLINLKFTKTFNGPYRKYLGDTGYRLVVTIDDSAITCDIRLGDVHLYEDTILFEKCKSKSMMQNEINNLLKDYMRFYVEPTMSISDRDT